MDETAKGLQHMRKFALIAVAMTAGLGLAACSEKTQDNAAETADSASTDAANMADSAGDAISDAATDVGQAASDAGAAAKEGAAKVESDVQNEPVEKSKQD